LQAPADQVICDSPEPDSGFEPDLLFSPYLAADFTDRQVRTNLLDRRLELIDPAATKEIITLAQWSRFSLVLQGHLDELQLFLDRLGLEAQKYRSEGRPIPR
jgi:hypothetical protein